MENDTQVCDLSWNTTQDGEEDKENSPVAVFSMIGQKLLVYPGKKYVIGRGRDASLSVPIKSLSKSHIQVEFIGGSHLVTDLGSRNKTRRGKLVLRPNVVYELPDKATLLLGDTEASYDYINPVEPVDWNFSVTGNITSNNRSSTPAKAVRINEDVEALEISGDGDGESSDVEAVPASQFVPQLDESSVLYVEDSPQKTPGAENISSIDQVPETPGPTKGMRVLDLTEDSLRETSLMNTRKELETLEKLQGEQTAIPDSQNINDSFGTDGNSDAGSLVLQLETEVETKSDDRNSEKRRLTFDDNSDAGSVILDLDDGHEAAAPEIQYPQGESEDLEMDDMNTQCWDMEPVKGTDTDLPKAEPDKGADSDMEITCLDKTENVASGLDESVISAVSGGFSPTSAPPTQVAAVDSDATDCEEDPEQNRPPAGPQPEESLIESPVMSESELENSVDRRDIYRRSMVKGIAEDGELWAAISATKASSSGTQESAERTPPYDTFASEIARTPPLRASPPATPQKVLKVVPPPHGYMTDFLEGDVEFEGVEESTQEPPEPMLPQAAAVRNSEVENTQAVPDSPQVVARSRPGELAECERTKIETGKQREAERTVMETESQKKEEGERTKTETEQQKEEGVRGDVLDGDIPEEEEEESTAELPPDDDDLTECEDEGEDVDQEGNPDVDLAETQPIDLTETQPIDLAETQPIDLAETQPIDNGDEGDSLEITGVQEACSLSIIAVKGALNEDESVVENHNQEEEKEEEDDLDADSACTLELDVKLLGGTDDFDFRKVKGEPSSQRIASSQEEGKAFLSMFEEEEYDEAVLDSQLNSLPMRGGISNEEASYKSPVKRTRRAAPAAKKSPARKGRQSKRGKITPNYQEFEEEGKFGAYEFQSQPDIVCAHPAVTVVREQGAPPAVMVARERGAPSTILKLDSVEELLRKRREIKQKLDDKETAAALKSTKTTKTKTRGKKKVSENAASLDDDDLPEFGLMDEDDSGDESDEIVLLDLISSVKPVKREPEVKEKECVPVAEIPKSKGPRKRKAESQQDPKEETLPAKKERVAQQRTLPEKRSTGRQRVFSESEDDFQPGLPTVPDFSERELCQPELPAPRVSRRRKESTETHDSAASIPVSRSRKSSKKQIIESEEEDEKPVIPVGRGKRAANKSTEKEKPVPVPASPVGRRKRSVKKEKEEEEEEVSSQPPTPVRPNRRAAKVKQEPDCEPPSPVRGRKGARNRQLKPDVQAFLEEAKSDLKPRRGGRKITVKQEGKLENQDEEEEKRAPARGRGKARGGGRGAKRSVERAAVKEESRTPSPVITVGRGKRKKLSGSVKEEAVSPMANIVNKSYGKSYTTPPARRATISKKVDIVYTGIEPSGPMKKTISALGGVLSSDISSCSHLVTDRIKRTSKFLCAIGRGIPIATEMWLKESKKSSFFLDATDYTVQDTETERKYKFVLRRSVEAARTCPFLSGWAVFVTKSCEPSAEQLLPIIGCNGGELMKRAPKPSDHNTLIIATSSDNLVTLSKSKAPICSTELILTGALRQELCIKEFSLRNTSPEL